MAANDADDDIILASLGVIAVLNARRRSKSKKVNRTIWHRQWVARRTHNLLTALRTSDAAGFRNFVRMYEDSFTQLLQKVSPRIIRTNTNMRHAIPPAERLALRLRYLATGKQSVWTMAHLYLLYVIIAYMLYRNAIGRSSMDLARRLARPVSSIDLD